MTPRSFFIIILKVFGLFNLYTIINSLYPVINSIFQMIEAYSLDAGFYTLIFYLVAMALLIWLCYYLLMKPGWVVDKLKLDKGFEEEQFTFRFSPTKILLIALFVVAGLLLIDNIAISIKIIGQYIQYRRIFELRDESNLSQLIEPGIKIIFGLLLIGERKRIVSLMIKNQ